MTKQTLSEKWARELAELPPEKREKLETELRTLAGLLAAEYDRRNEQANLTLAQVEAAASLAAAPAASKRGPTPTPTEEKWRAVEGWRRARANGWKKILYVEYYREKYGLALNPRSLERWETELENSGLIHRRPRRSGGA